MPEIYCQVFNRNIDGGYYAFVCELPEAEKKIFYNSVRGIYAECNFCEDIPEPEPIDCLAINEDEIIVAQCKTFSYKNLKFLLRN